MTTEIIQTFLGFGTIIIAFAYAFARKFKNDEYTRTFLFLAFLLFVVMLLISIVYK